MNLTGMNELKVGDTVFVIHYGTWNRHINVHSVAKVTPKQFVSQTGRLLTKFRKSDGMELGSSSEWYKDYAFPDNQNNREEYEAHIEKKRLNARARDLLGNILVAVKKLREEDLEKMEQIAAILEIEE